MIEAIKDKIAGLVVNSKLKSADFERKSFSEFFKKSFSFFVIMPEDESDFHSSIEVLHGLVESKKNPTIFTYDYRVSLIPSRFRPNIIEHEISDKNRLNLPSKKLLDKLNNLNFQVVIDLNRAENIYFSYLANLVSSPIRAGFVKNNSDKYYNVQIVKEDDVKNSYENFLNCLRMF